MQAYIMIQRNNLNKAKKILRLIAGKISLEAIRKKTKNNKLKTKMIVF